MNTDYRIRVGFFRHLKTKKLEKRLGESGVLALLKLWGYATEFRPEGDLSGLSNEDLELAIDWKQDTPLIQVLAEVGFLDGEAGNYQLHDWIEHNPWVSESSERSDAARLSRLARKHPEVAKALKGQGRTGITADEYRQYERSTTVLRPLNDRTTTVERTHNDRTTERTTPAPAPAPAPKEGKAVQNISAPAPDTRIEKSAPVEEPEPDHDRDKDFAAFWEAYPPRAGGNPKAPALKAWKARRKEGHTAEAIIAGTSAYATYCAATGKLHTEYVKQASTFINQMAFLDNWKLPAAPPPSRQRPQQPPSSPEAAEFDAILQNMGNTRPVIEGICTHEIH